MRRPRGNRPLQTCPACVIGNTDRFNGPSLLSCWKISPRETLIRSNNSGRLSPGKGPLSKPVLPCGKSTNFRTLGFAMTQAAQPFRRLRFGVFEADFRTGELTKRGKRVRLQEQPFQLLAMLLDRPGDLVTREELHGKLWPQTIVDFDHGLNKAISKIREALGDSAENPRFIETVARRGYRFLADVAVVRGGQPETVTDDLAARGDPGLLGLADGGTSPRRLPHPWRLFGAGLALVLAISLSWIFYPWRSTDATIRSLAVLPLENLSGDASQDYFVDGMTDELITHLGQINTLRVISRMSVMTYKNVRKPLAEIAHELTSRPWWK